MKSSNFELHRRRNPAVFLCLNASMHGFMHVFMAYFVAYFFQKSMVFKDDGSVKNRINMRLRVYKNIHKRFPSGAP